MAGLTALVIDLGTTYSLAATMVASGNGKHWYPKILSNTVGKELTPSVVYFDPKDCKSAVGDVALNLWRQTPTNVVRWIKRRMGDPTFRVEAKGKDTVESFTPQQISAIILRHIISYAQKKAPDEQLKTLVITVPAFFGDNEKQATLDAASLLGLNAILIEEPTAAVLDYVHDKVDEGSIAPSQGEKYFAVFDLGGGTFDISVAMLSWDQDTPDVKIVATQGHRKLGGFDFDLDLACLAIDRLIVNYPDRKLDFQRLRTAITDYRASGITPTAELWEAAVSFLDSVEFAKCQLSTLPSHRLYVPHSSLFVGASFGVDISQSDIEAIMTPHLKEMEDRVNLALATARDITSGRLSDWAQVERVILVGGSTRIPCVQDLVRRLFQQEPRLDGDEDKAVARGAAIYAGIKAGFGIRGKFQRKTVHAYGVVTGDSFAEIIKRGSPYPPATATMQIPVRFVLSPNAPLLIAQSISTPTGSDHLEVIRKVDYYHPILYTGDQLDVTLNIDENGLLQVVAEDSTGERVEERVQSIALTPETQEQQRKQINNWPAKAS